MGDTKAQVMKSEAAPVPVADKRVEPKPEKRSARGMRFPQSSLASPPAAPPPDDSPAPERARGALLMQRSMGNARLVRMLETSPGAADQGSASNEAPAQSPSKLLVGAPGDAYEQQADEVASRVTNRPETHTSGTTQRSGVPGIQARPMVEPRIQRQCTECGGECECGNKIVQLKADTEPRPARLPGAAQNHIESPGRGEALSASVRSRVEPELGEDLSQVQVHKDTTSREAAGALKAKAFTRGDHIFLGQGASAEDAGLMAHEATHSVQQRGDAKVAQRIQRDSEDGWLESIGEGLSNAGGALLEAGQAGVSAVGEGLGSLAGMGRDAILSLLRQISPELADFVERGPLSVIKEKIQDVLGGWMSTLTGGIGLGPAVEGIKSGFTAAFEAVRGAVAGDEKSCASFAGMLNGLFEFAQGIIHNPIAEAAREAITKVHEVFGTIVSTFAETAVEGLKFLWEGISAFAGMVGDWIGTVREAVGYVWDWVAEQLGLSGPEGGVLDWIKEKANAAWQFVKDEIAPAALQGFTEAGRFIYEFSGLKAFHDLLEAGGKFIDAVQWLWAHRNDPDIATRAAEDPEVKDTILPQVLSASKDFGEVINQALDWVSDQAGALVTRLLGLLENISGVPILGLAEGFVDALGERAAELRDWVAETLPQVSTDLKKAVDRIWNTIKPVISVVSLLIIGIANPPLLPIVVSGLLGAALWYLLPDCYKPPIINFLLDLAIEVLSAMPDLPLFGPLWSLLRPGLIGFLEELRDRSDEEKIAVTNKIAKIMLFSGIDFILGFVWGFLKGVWESITDPFVMLWMLGKGLFNVTAWMARMGERFFGEPATATPEQTPSDQELGTRVVEMAHELQPPAVEVRDNFFNAAKEYFSGSEGASFDTLREKLGEAWDDAQTSMEGQGKQLADRAVGAMLAPNAEEVAAASVFKVGEVIGWLAGTLVTEVLIAIFSAGTVTAAKGVMKVVTAIAKVIDKIGDIFGAVFRLIGKLGKGLFKLIKGLGGMFARAGRGAIRTVIDALTTIAQKLIKFADEILARISGRAGREVGEEVAERGAREVGEEAGERGVGEVAEELGERGAREVAEEAGERGAREAGEEAGERGGRDAATEAAEKPAALVEARGIAEVHDAINAPVPVVISNLMALKSRYRWIDTFQARLKPVPGHFSLHMIASDTEVDKDYTPGDIQLGDEVGEGAYKKVYKVDGDETKVVAIPKSNDLGELQEELDLLRQIEAAGGPTINVHGIVDIGGRPGMVMDNYPNAISVKPFGTIDEIDEAFPRLGEQSLDDLRKLKALVSNHEVDDFQVMITEGGRVLIHDPRGFSPRPGGQRVVNTLVDEMIKQAGGG